MQRRLSSLIPARHEWSGAFADLGILIPLEASLIAVNGLNATSTLLGVGIMYVAAGRYFRMPMPVQPLKALAAIAVAQQLSADVIAAGALLMALSLVLLAATGAIDVLYRNVPVVVIRGIQIGLAYVLIRGAVSLLERPLATGSGTPDVALGSASIPLTLAVAPVALIALIVLVRRPVLPASLAILGAGVAVGIALRPDALSGIGMGPAPMSMGLPDTTAFATAFTVLLAAQLPLTLANSVIATTDAARAYFPASSHRATPRRLSLSIAAGNVWAGLFGGLPVCHGSGGLTAHYSLGARTSRATAITGVTLIFIAIAFGATGLALRHVVPLPFFGVLLLFVGLQHAKLALAVPSNRDLAFVAFAGILAVVLDGNLAIAALATYAAYQLTQGWMWAWPRVVAVVVSATAGR